MSFKEIKSEDLKLRKLSLEDSAAIYRLRSETDVQKYFNRVPANNEQDAIDFIEKINEVVAKGLSFYWGICLKESDLLVGTICLWNFNADFSEAEIGFELLPEHQHKGMMSIAVSLVIDYAFADLKLKKIEAFVHQENLASIKLLEKFDFNFTKIIQEEHIVSKEMSPLHVYQKINHLL